MQIGANSPYHATKQQFDQKKAQGTNDMLSLLGAQHKAISAGQDGQAAIAQSRQSAKNAPRDIPMPQYSMGGVAKPAPSKEDVVAEFLEYAQKTTEEKLREQILKAMGLTEEDLDSMTPEQRKGVEEQIVRTLKEKMQEAAREQQAKESQETQDSPLARKDGEAPSLLAPTLMNIRHLAESAQKKLEAIREQYGISEEARYTVRFDGEKGGYRIEVAGQADASREARRALERLLAENPAIEREMQAVMAMTHVHAAIQERIPFIQEYQAARTPAETQAAVQKYSHWFGGSVQSQAEVSLTYGNDALNVMLDASPLEG